jgi:SAM-dependent methyltransferase
VFARSILGEATLPIKQFDQAAYWIERHERLRGDILSVGDGSLSRERLELSERYFVENLNSALDNIEPVGRVLDIGCGYGRAAPSFMSRGWDYTGVDVSPVAIEDAQRRAPGGRFLVGDLNTWNTEERFGLVAALYVFIHFTNDGTWESLVERCLSWVAPSGSLLICDRWPASIERRTVETVTRPERNYAPVLAKHGFVFDHELERRLGDATHYRIASRQ